MARVVRRDIAGSKPHQPWEPSAGPLPALYISHGAPPLLEDADWMRRLFAWARELPDDPVR
ncbi:MAG: hypothetical protein WCF04_14590 [Candidatus Nanopelagicales bacterium]